MGINNSAEGKGPLSHRDSPTMVTIERRSYFSLSPRTQLRIRSLFPKKTRSNTNRRELSTPEHCCPALRKGGYPPPSWSQGSTYPPEASTHSYWLMPPVPRHVCSAEHHLFPHHLCQRLKRLRRGGLRLSPRSTSNS